MRARVSIAVGLIALLAAPAWAQQKPMQRYGEKDKEKSFTEQQAEKDAERAYQRSLGNVPEKGPADPWGNARSAEAPKAAKGEAKTLTAKPKAKAAGAPN
jgi:hypothetical protein